MKLLKNKLTVFLSLVGLISGFIGLIYFFPKVMAFLGLIIIIVMFLVYTWKVADIIVEEWKNDD